MIVKATVNDLEKIEKLIGSVDLDKSLFIKPTKGTINQLVDSTFLFKEKDEIIGCVILSKEDGFYMIRNIISLRKGIGSLLLSFLMKKDLNYCYTISPNNKKSERLFKKFGFKLKNNILVKGYPRNIFQNY